MTNVWRSLTLAAALNCLVGIGAASAQVVVVTGAPPGSNVELVLNATPLGSAAVDEHGDARLPLDLQKNLGKKEIDANVFVDVCGTLRRVLVVERGGQLPASDASCERRELSGLYWVRDVSSVVVDVGVAPSVLLIKGSYNPREATAMRAPRLAPTGLVLFGSGGLGNYRDAVAIACGNVTDCSGKGSRPGFTAGADYWLTRFLAAEATYVRPSNMTARGTESTYRFDSSVNAHVFTAAGKVGAPIGIVRIYGRVGADYHRATTASAETIDDRTITIDGVDQTIKGGTQSFELKTRGWGWLFGGGMEVWASRSVAIYGDINFASLKGHPKDDKERRMDDRLALFFLGLRFHIGG
jgi:hypothetical protein